MFGAKLSRRRVLQTSAAAVAGGLTTSLAGCASILGGGGGKYSNWLHEPGTLDDSADHYSFTYLEPSVLAEHEDELGDAYDDLESWFGDYDPGDVDFEDMTSYLRFNPVTVIQGDYDTGEVVEELEDNGYDDEDEVSGFTLFLSEDERRAAGVSGSHVVTGRAVGDEEPLDVVETAVETYGGEEDRYREESDDFDVLLNHLGSGTYHGGRTTEEVDGDDLADGQFDHQVASGWSLTPNGETTEFRVVRVYEEDDDVDLDTLEEWTEEMDGSGETFNDVDDISVSQNGRAGIVTGTLDTDDWW